MRKNSLLRAAVSTHASPLCSRGHPSLGKQSSHCALSGKLIAQTRSRRLCCCYCICFFLKQQGAQTCRPAALAENLPSLDLSSPEAASIWRPALNYWLTSSLRRHLFPQRSPFSIFPFPLLTFLLSRFFLFYFLFQHENKLTFVEHCRVNQVPYLI